MKVAITGGTGFLGWHLRCRLAAVEPGAEVRVANRADLGEAKRLADLLDGCDVVFHLAGVNTHGEEASENVDLARALVDALDACPEPPARVVYGNSTHAEGDSPYGRAKRAAADVLGRGAERAGAALADVMLPNLYGEGGRPHYNSVVATFCDAVVTGSPVDVDPTGRVELLHAQDAARALLRSAVPASGATPTRDRIAGTQVSVATVHDHLARFFEVYAGTHTVPEFESRFHLRLFNQLRTAMFPDWYPVQLRRHVDTRGAFFEGARATGPSQTSFSTTAPGITRGEHWHFDKIERFLVLRGTARIEIRRLFDETIRCFDVTGERLAFIDMPTLHTHSITNVGDDELLTMFWANDHFDPAEPDTFPEPVAVNERVPR